MNRSTHSTLTTLIVASGIAAAIASGLATIEASAHGTAENPVAPANLTRTSIIHRLTQLGYTDIKVLNETEDSANVELSKDGKRFNLTVSKKLTGPATLTRADAATEVQRGLTQRPPAGPGGPPTEPNTTTPP